MTRIIIRPPTADPNTRSDDAHAQRPERWLRMAEAAALHALRQRARDLAAADACPELRALLRALCPGRERVAAAAAAAAAATSARVPLRLARAADLLLAIEGEVALGLRRVPGARCAYREAELLHRAAASAAASGALDVGARGACAPAAVARLRGGAVCALLAHPGAYLLPGALTLAQQEGLVRAALRVFCERPNRRNLDAFCDPDASNVQWAAQHGQDSSQLQPRRGAAAAVAQAGGFPSGLWAAYAASDGATRLPIDALAWASLGLHYDWTARAYHLPQDSDYAEHAHGGGGGGGGGGPEGASRWRTPFPPCLQALCGGLVAGLAEAVEEALCSGQLPLSDAGSAAWGLPLSLHAQAAIVNLYRGQAKLKLPMGGHSDNMERTLARPVVSLSLGAPAVFLLGGASKDAPPTPLLLRSGDVLVLSGASRAAYHGVPRVFEAEGCGGLFEGGGSGSAAAAAAAAVAAAAGAQAEAAPEAWRKGSPAEEAAFRRFLDGSRININVRQVVEEPVDP